MKLAKTVRLRFGQDFAALPENYRDGTRMFRGIGRIQDLTDERNLVGVHLGLHSQVDAVSADSIKQLSRNRGSRPHSGSYSAAGTIEQQLCDRSLCRAKV
ncbi:MAG: hypothetical protein ACREDR_48710, partial [Blastocatellia bacterium]